jgi:hypothetical protein
MRVPVRVPHALVVALLVVSSLSGAHAAGAQTASEEVRPPVLVTGDSLSHQAADDIAEALAALGYHDVTFNVYGGTTIGWSTDRVLESPAPIVVFASGTYNALLGWTATDAEQADRAVSVLSQRSCAIWVLPAAARYPSGVRRPDAPSAATVDGIRRAVSGSSLHLGEWDIVADARPEIHVYDGVHLDDEGQDIYAALVAGSVRHRCEPPDPARTAPWERYTTWAHRTLLRRDPTSAELATWSDRLTAGHDRLAFTRPLTDSPEWAGVQIDDLYRRALGRDAEPAGRAYWRDLVVGGMPLDGVAAHLFGSEEFLARAGGTPTGFVTALYRQVLHREPDQSGHAFWLRHLAGGTSRPTVAGAFYASPESRGDRVDVLYRSILGREPDPAGRANWVDALPHMTDLRLAALLASSAEAFQRAQVGDG